MEYMKRSVLKAIRDIAMVM